MAVNVDARPAATQPAAARNQDGLGGAQAPHAPDHAHAVPVFNYTVAPDSRTIVFVTTEPAGFAIPSSIRFRKTARRLNRVTAGQARQA